MGYDEDDMHPLMGTVLLGGVMFAVLMLARWVYHWPWAHWWHWLTTW